MTKTDILAEIKSIFKTKWSTREGKVVPDSESIKLGNDAVLINGTVLYADLTDSTDLVNDYKDWFAAEIYKSYLVGACRMIRDKGGEITAFDGDRVMAVFLGNSKNTLSAKAALHINYIVQEINTLLKQEYPSTAYKLRQSIGIDTSKLFVAKTGIRNANDLVWVGRAANYAAKLCSLRESNYSIYITEDVYNQLADEAKYGGTPRQNMWEKRIWTDRGINVYQSNWWWKIN